jgi:mannitol-specific phosphotransferase system IIBC component
MTTNNPTQVGTLGGTFLSIIPNIPSEDIIKTIILAAVGALVSYTVSILLRRLPKKRKKQDYQ